MDIDPGCVADGELMAAMRIAGCPESELLFLMAKVLQPGDYMIDGGANIGFFTLFASQLVGKEGYVLSFEPGCNNLPKLKDNVRLNKITNVEIVPHPIWSKREAVQLHLCFDGSKNSLSPHDGSRGAQLLEAVMLNDYATEEIRPRLRLMKLDIEGAELAALKGGDDFLREPDQCPYIVVELNLDALPKFDATIDKVRAYMRQFGYSMFLLQFDGRMPVYVPRHTNVLPNRLNFNALFSTAEAVGKAWPEIAA
jgi:FkbM family methyltransferase